MSTNPSMPAKRNDKNYPERHKKVTVYKFLLYNHIKTVLMKAVDKKKGTTKPSVESIELDYTGTIFLQDGFKPDRWRQAKKDVEALKEMQEETLRKRERENLNRSVFLDIAIDIGNEFDENDTEEIVTMTVKLTEDGAKESPLTVTNIKTRYVREDAINKEMEEFELNKSLTKLTGNTPNLMENSIIDHMTRLLFMSTLTKFRKDSGSTK